MYICLYPEILYIIYDNFPDCDCLRQLPLRLLYKRICFIFRSFVACFCLFSNRLSFPPLVVAYFCDDYHKLDGNISPFLRLLHALFEFYMDLFIYPNLILVNKNRHNGFLILIFVFIGRGLFLFGSICLYFFY